MIDHDELRQRILSELEEAGEETPTSMLNTVISPTGDPTEIVSFLKTLEALSRENLIRMSDSRDSSGRLAESSLTTSLSAVSALDSQIRFDPERRIWVDSRRVGPPFKELFPYILVTDPGREAARNILDLRGYKWWRSRK